MKRSVVVVFISQAKFPTNINKDLCNFFFGFFECRETPISRPTPIGGVVPPENELEGRA